MGKVVAALKDAYPGQMDFAKASAIVKSAARRLGAIPRPARAGTGNFATTPRQRLNWTCRDRPAGPAPALQRGGGEAGVGRGRRLLGGIGRRGRHGRSGGGAQIGGLLDAVQQIDGGDQLLVVLRRRAAHRPAIPSFRRRRSSDDP